MKIEMTTSHYSSARGFKLSGAGVHEVPDERGQYLLASFPSWFRPVEGEESIKEAPTDSQSGSDAPQDAQNEANEPQPSKNLSKMNKDELRTLAGDLGIEVTDEMTNKDLQQAIKSQEK